MKEEKVYLRKYNYLTHCYDIVELKRGNYKCYSINMDEIVNCPHCREKISFGESYTSLEFHTRIGFGYAVCKNCYEKETERRNFYEKNK